MTQQLLTDYLKGKILGGWRWAGRVGFWEVGWGREGCIVLNLSNEHVLFCKCLNVWLHENVDTKEIWKFKKSEWNSVMLDRICMFEEEMSCVTHQVFLFISEQRSLGLGKPRGTGKEEPGFLENYQQWHHTGNQSLSSQPLHIPFGFAEENWKVNCSVSSLNRGRVMFIFVKEINWVGLAALRPEVPLSDKENVP